MIRIDDLPEVVLDDLRDAGYSDEEIQKMGWHKAFGLWLSWNGIHGYTDSIIEALDGIRIASDDYQPECDSGIGEGGETE